MYRLPTVQNPGFGAISGLPVIRQKSLEDIRQKAKSVCSHCSDRVPKVRPGWVAPMKVEVGGFRRAQFDRSVSSHLRVLRRLDPQ
jgi:hypothetical protein